MFELFITYLILALLSQCWCEFEDRVLTDRKIKQDNVKHERERLKRVIAQIEKERKP